MRLIKCENCDKSAEFSRLYYMILPDNFNAVKLNEETYEFCSLNCRNTFLLHKLSQNDKIETIK